MPGTDKFAFCLSVAALLTAIPGAGLAVRWWISLSGTALVVAMPWLMAQMSLQGLHAAMTTLGAPPMYVQGVAIAVAVATASLPVAVLGARGPRYGAWHVVIASYALIMLFPLVEQGVTGRFAGPAGPALDGMRVALLVALNVVLAANYATSALRLPVAAFAMAGAAQALLVSPWAADQHRHLFLSTELVSAAAMLSCSAYRLHGSATGPLECRWRLFRDFWGIAWSYRVMERFNEEAARLGIPATLQWHEALEPPSPDDTSRAVLVLEQLTRRFVPAEWFQRYCPARRYTHEQQ